MNTQVTETDLRRFASVGFPASVRAVETTDVRLLAQSAVRALEAPSARLTTAVTKVLEHLALSDDLGAFFTVEFSDEARRRLGYLAERFAQRHTLELYVSQRLESLAFQLRAPGDSSKPPLTLMAKTSPTLLRLQAQRADALNKRWNVLDG